MWSNYSFQRGPPGLKLFFGAFRRAVPGEERHGGGGAFLRFFNYLCKRARIIFRLLMVLMASFPGLEVVDDDRASSLKYSCLTSDTFFTFYFLLTRLRWKGKVYTTYSNFTPH